MVPWRLKAKWKAGWRGKALDDKDGSGDGAPLRPVVPEVDEAWRQNWQRVRRESLPELDEAHIQRAWAWWVSVGNPRFIMAPMVGQSDLPYRQLVRRYGVGLCYTPMYEHELILEGAFDAELSQLEGRNADGGPLVLQISGNFPRDMLSAARRVQNLCDAIDVNFGCPQRCAREGNYGAYLMSQPDTMCAIVRTLSDGLDVPVVAKMRILESLDDTLELAWRLQAAGASALAVHGRLIHQRDHQGPASWLALREIKYALRIPVIANGSMHSAADAEACLALTGCDAVMSATGLLRCPSMFATAPESPLGSLNPILNIILTLTRSLALTLNLALTLTPTPT